MQISFESGNSLLAKGSFKSADRTKWNAGEINYVNAAGQKLILKGSIKLDEEDGVSTESVVNASEIVDPIGTILISSARPERAGFTGRYSFEVSGDELVVGLSAASKYAIMPDGNKFELNGNIREHSRDETPGIIKDARVYDAEGEVLLQISELDLLGTEEEEAAIQAGVDAFIEYFLSGNDVVRGTKGDDNLYSGSGNDSVNSGDGADLIIGGKGGGNDSYDGGKGIDTLKYTSATAAITVDLAKGSARSIAGNDAAGIGIDKLKGIENIISGSYADMLTGSKDANVIDAGAGDDTIGGGLGKDTLTGGAGVDQFVFSMKPAANNIDTITDFEVGVDKLVLSKKIFAKLAGAADYLALGTSSGSASRFLNYDSATGALSYDADGSGMKSKPVIIALIGPGLDLTTSDCLVV